MRPSPPVLALAWALAALALAGCLGAGDRPPPVDPDPAPGGAAGFAYACPPGPTTVLPGDLCVGSLWDPRETFEEPYLAVHPARPEVLALGLNAWHADPRPVLGPAGPGAELVRMAVFVSEDAGASWRALDLPPTRFGNPGAAAAHGTADPALAFDARGVLHVTQLNAGFSGPFWFDVQYMATPDLGATWSEPRLLQDDGDNDRNWLTVGPDGTLWASWRNTIQGPAPPELTWSRDGGATWAGPTSPDPACTGGARPLVLGEGVLLACELHREGTPTGIAVHRLDPGAGAWAKLAEVPTPPGWDPGGTLFTLWDAAPDGTVALLTRQASPGGFLAVSRDGGATWAEPLLLADLCGCGGQERLVGYWGELDPWGGFHLLLRDGYLGTPDNPNEDNARYAAGDLSTWHVLVDLDAGRAVQERLLTGPDPGFRRVPPSAAPPIGRDDYYKPAFWDGGGALVWTRDQGIDLTLLAPLDGPAAQARRG